MKIKEKIEKSHKTKFLNYRATLNGNVANPAFPDSFVFYFIASFHLSENNNRKIFIFILFSFYFHFIFIFILFSFYLSAISNKKIAACLKIHVKFEKQLSFSDINIIGSSFVQKLFKIRLSIIE